MLTFNEFNNCYRIIFSEVFLLTYSHTMDPKPKSKPKLKSKPSPPSSSKQTIDNDISKLEHKIYHYNNINENLSNNISEDNYQYQDKQITPISNYIYSSYPCPCYPNKHFPNYNVINHPLPIHHPCLRCASPSKPINYPHPLLPDNKYDKSSLTQTTFSPITHYTNHSDYNLTQFYGNQLNTNNNLNTNNHQIRLKKKMHQHHECPNNFGFSKFSIEIRCLFPTSRKNNEDVIKKVTFLEEKINQKENTINNLLNNIMFLENQLNNYRNENENLKN